MTTKTATFGTTGREGHDATAFYDRFPVPTLQQSDDVRISGIADPCVCDDARNLGKYIEPNSVALVVTSPPYFVGKDYELALGEGVVPATYLDHLRMLEDVFAACVEVMEPGGRIAVNVANLGRKPYRSLSADVIRIFERLGLLLRGEIIWRKAEGATGSCAWGSYKSATNPVLRDLTERVIVASKWSFSRAIAPRRRAELGLPHENTITAEAFMRDTLDVWDIRPESAKRVGHPAPFPVELPARLIGLYTFLGDLVMDPFMGAGTTLVAAHLDGRRGIGFDTSPAYVELARNRLAALPEVPEKIGAGAQDEVPDAEAASLPVDPP